MWWPMRSRATCPRFALPDCAPCPAVAFGEGGASLERAIPIGGRACAGIARAILVSPKPWRRRTSRSTWFRGHWTASLKVGRRRQSLATRYARCLLARQASARRPDAIRSGSERARREADRTGIGGYGSGPPGRFLAGNIDGRGERIGPDHRFAQAWRASVRS
jgi:hypothetical protein